jgi:hypothetical protein
MGTQIATEQAAIKQLILKAMKDPDRFCLRMIYVDDVGRRTRRVVSPSKWGAAGRYSFSGLCMSREEWRWFKTRSVEQAELIESSTVLMPVEIEEIKG